VRTTKVFGRGSQRSQTTQHMWGHHYIKQFYTNISLPQFSIYGFTSFDICFVTRLRYHLPWASFSMISPRYHIAVTKWLSEPASFKGETVMSKFVNDEPSSAVYFVRTYVKMTCKLK